MYRQDDIMSAICFKKKKTVGEGKGMCMCSGKGRKQNCPGVDH